MSEDNVIVVGLNEDLRKAILAFVLKPTNSGRIKFQQDLRSIAMAFEVESNNGDFDLEERENVMRAVTVLRDLADEALFADPVVVADMFNVRIPEKKSAAPKKPARGANPAVGAVRVLGHLAKMFRKS